MGGDAAPGPAEASGASPLAGARSWKRHAARAWAEAGWRAEVEVNLSEGDLRDAGIVRRIETALSAELLDVGRSSLATVHRLPADDLKLDPSFDADIGRREGNQAIVRAVLALAHELGLLVTAGGVQDDEAFETLGALGCDAAQSPALAQAMTAPAALGWALDERTSARDWEGAREAAAPGRPL